MNPIPDTITTRLNIAADAELEKKIHDCVECLRLAAGSGKFVINGRPLESYFSTETLQMVAGQAFVATEAGKKLDVRINVADGGPNGQVGAVRHEPTLDDFPDAATSITAIAFAYLRDRHRAKKLTEFMAKNIGIQ